MPGGRVVRRRPTVRTRILATMLVVTTLGMAIAGLLTYQAQRSFVVDQVDEALRTQLGLARTAAADESATSVRAVLERILSVTVAPQDGGSLGIVGTRAAYLPGVVEHFRPEELPGFVEAVAGEDGTRIDTFEGPDGAVRYLAVPVAVAGDAESGIYVTAIDLDARLAGVERSAQLFAAVSLAVLLLTAALGWFVAGRLLAPIRRLRDTAERITVNALGERIPVDGSDDVSRLTATVNGMLDRIGDGIEQQRVLLADLRHQLRVPLTLVRGHLELVDIHDAADVAETRRVAMDEVDRMTRMVDELARLVELGLPAAARSTVDTGALTREVHERVRAVPGRAWSIGRADAVMISVERDRVIEAWLQLADNATRYTPAGTPIELSAVADAETVRLAVRDHGAGVPEADRERIFLRGERGAREGSAGTGLGLAIVAAIARANGGTAEVSAPEGGGAEFAIVLPRAGRGVDG
jgi:signal transduction histidine kinase